MSPSIELTYFDGAGRAEMTRVCLSIAKVEWKDTRFGFPDWPTIKPTTPLGSVPTLKVDDFQHCQSIAIARYAAKLAGLYPEDPVQALFCDEVLDTLNELMSKAPKSKDADELKKLREEFQATVMTTTGTFIENIIQTNGKGKSVCDVPSVADLAVMGIVDSITSGNWDHIDPNFFDSYPGIKECYKTIKDHPGVKAYYDSKAEKKDEL